MREGQEGVRRSWRGGPSVAELPLVGLLRRWTSALRSSGKFAGCCAFSEVAPFLWLCYLGRKRPRGVGQGEDHATSHALGCHALSLFCFRDASGLRFVELIHGALGGRKGSDARDRRSLCSRTPGIPHRGSTRLA